MNDDDLDATDHDRDEQLCAFPTCARRTRGIFCAKHRVLARLAVDDADDEPRDDEIEGTP